MQRKHVPIIIETGLVIIAAAVAVVGTKEDHDSGKQEGRQEREE